MHLYVQKELFSMTVVALFIIVLSVYAGHKIKKADPLAKEKGIVLLALWFVELMDNSVLNTVRKDYVKRLSPYIGTLVLFLFLCNISGLFGLNAPTMNYSVTLTMAFITWFMIQYNAIRDNGIKAYLHGFIEPIVPFIVPNFFGKIAPLISMSIRLFGNILSGSIIMTLVYTATGGLTDLVFSLFGLSGVPNIFGMIFAPPLHAYFDVFAGFIQMFIFISLTQVFISNELNEDKEVS